MGFITFILIFVLALSSLMLVGLVLIQKGKGEGLGMSFGQGMGESIFGSRAGNVLTKATVVLAVIFMCTTLGLAILFSKASSGDESVMDGFVETSTTAPTLPEADASAEGSALIGAPVDEEAYDTVPPLAGDAVEAAKEAVVEAAEVAEVVEAAKEAAVEAAEVAEAVTEEAASAEKVDVPAAE